MPIDYYKILQVDPEAEAEVIKAAHRRLVEKYHPDRNRDGDAEARMKRINVAFDVLKDPEARKQYDRSRRAAAEARRERRNAAGKSAQAPTQDTEQARAKEAAVLRYFWMVSCRGETVGPVSYYAVCDWAARGMIHPGTFVQNATGGPWIPFEQSEFASIPQPRPSSARFIVTIACTVGIYLSVALLLAMCR